jgi:hypothetical protein
MMTIPRRITMPALEIQDYEHFSYDEPSLTLDEAVRKSSELRKKDGNNFYRIVPVNDSATTFAVKKVPVSEVYADLAARVARILGRYRLRGRTK